MLQPSLSIIIPSYNYGHFLEESLDSIVSQDFEDYEIILVDDCSTDMSPTISRSYSEKYSHLHYIAHPTNLGLFQTVLTGYKKSAGKYIHYFSVDDKYLPGFLSKSMHFLYTHPQAAVVCTDLAYFQNSSDVLEIKKLLRRCQKPLFISKDDIISTFRTTSFWVTGTSCIAKREIIEKYGPHISELENLSDWFLFHTIALCEGIGYIPEVLMSMRIHDKSFTSQVKRNKKRRRNTYHYLLHLLLLQPHLRRYFLKAGLLDFIFRDLKWKLYLNPKYVCFWKKNKRIHV